jgi:DNA-binding NarL/FixJ family response regulator
MDYPFDDKGKLLVRVVYDDSQQPQPSPPSVATTIVDDHILVHEGVGAFLKVFDDIKLRDDAASQISAQKLPDVVVIDKEEFNKRVMEHEALRQRSKRINNLIGSITQETSQ